MKILIDNGHGIDTKGKRSPDGRLLEYAQNRLLAENLFMDNHKDCDFLLSLEGQKAIVDLHVDGITAYLSTL